MRPESRVDLVHRALRRAIIEQALAPGAKLPEEIIGERFGVSRTIVRRALERLAGDELVTLQPNRGASIAAPTLEEARDLFSVRMELEDVVMRRLAGHITAAQLKQLKVAVHEESLAHHQGKPDYIRLSGEFHVTLAALSGSKLLHRYMQQLVWRSALALRLSGRPLWGDCNVREHRDLIETLATGDLQHCRDLMATHLNAVLSRALDGRTSPERPNLSEILSRYAPSSFVSN